MTGRSKIIDESFTFQIANIAYSCEIFRAGSHFRAKLQLP